MGRANITIEVVTHYNDVPLMYPALEEACSEATKLSSHSLADRMKSSMGGPGPRPPSLPGSPPARQTSDLYNSIKPKMLDKLHGGVEMSDIGELVNGGTSKMAPRPFIDPAVEQERSQYTENIKALFGRFGR